MRNYGSGDGDGDGYGFGSGDGDGSGSGYGSGDGSGDGWRWKVSLGPEGRTLNVGCQAHALEWWLERGESLDDAGDLFPVEKALLRAQIEMFIR